MSREGSRFGQYTGSPGSKERVEDDLYPTPEVATEGLLRHETFEGLTWECASGRGHISKILEAAGLNVMSTDLAAERYGYGEKLDFLTEAEIGMVDNIVTNPPYSLSKPFVEIALQAATKKVAMFLPESWAFQQGVIKLLDRVGWPNRTYVTVPALKIDMGSRGVKGSMFLHAWMVWDVDNRNMDARLDTRLIRWRGVGVDK